MANLLLRKMIINGDFLERGHKRYAIRAYAGEQRKLCQVDEHAAVECACAKQLAILSPLCSSLFQAFKIVKKLLF